MNEIHEQSEQILFQENSPWVMFEYFMSVLMNETGLGSEELFILFVYTKNEWLFR